VKEIVSTKGDILAKRALSTNVWNRIKASSFNYSGSGPGVGMAAEAAE